MPEPFEHARDLGDHSSFHDLFFFRNGPLQGRQLWVPFYEAMDGWTTFEFVTTEPAPFAHGRVLDTGYLYSYEDFQTVGAQVLWRNEREILPVPEYQGLLDA